MPTAALDELRELLGPSGVLVDPVDLVRYCEPVRGTPGSTPAVLRPSSVEQVRSVVRWARTHRVRLLPQGSASGLVGASTPPADAGVVVVSLERLAGAPRIDPVDRVAVVSAGTRLSALEAAAAPHGLTFPIDLGADPMIGGMVATNTGGARMLRHGDVRRHVLGLRAVIADEDCSVLDDLSTLRKHNMGPSPTHLLVGSSGAFGIVTDVALSLTALPASRACCWAIPRDADAVIEALVLLERRYPRSLEAFEVLSAEALDAASTMSSVRPFGDRPAPEVSVLIEFAADRADAEDRLVDALAELDAAGLVGDAVVLDPAHAWEPRHRVTEGLRRSGTVLGFDVAVPRPSLPRLRERIRERLDLVDPRIVVADFGHWGDGGVHCNLVLAEPPGPDRAALLADVVLGTVVDEFGGSFSAEHGIGPHNAQRWLASVSPAVRDLLAGIKAGMDPLGVLGHPGLPFS